MGATATSKRAVSLFIPFALGLWATAATAEPARIGDSPLNLRHAAATDAPIVARMPPGAAVEVLHCRGDWCRLRYQGTSGFAMARYLDRDGVAGRAAQAQAPAGSEAPAPMQARVVASRTSSNTDDDRNARVWRWDDPEWRDQHARRVQWHQRHAH